MDIETLKAFFMWCSLINGGLLAFWVGFLAFAPELVYNTQKRWFPLSRETFEVVMYGYLGLFKIFVLVFNVVPYLALLIMGCKSGTLAP